VAGIAGDRLEELRHHEVGIAIEERIDLARPALELFQLVDRNPEEIAAMMDAAA
jgi:hypothetical protein